MNQVITDEREQPKLVTWANNIESVTSRMVDLRKRMEAARDELGSAEPKPEKKIAVDAPLHLGDGRIEQMSIRLDILFAELDKLEAAYKAVDNLNL